MSQRVHIDRMSYGPHGVGRLDGKVVFVRGVVAGEDADILIREDRGSFAYAEPQQIIEPAAARRVPPCRFLPRCGGCPWQHMQYDEQLLAKEQNLRDHLTRHAGITTADIRPILAAAHEFGYRHRLTLRTEGDQVGFYAGGTHELVAIDHCLLAAPAADGAIATARSLLRTAASLIRRIEIVGREPDGQVVILVAEIEGKLDPHDGERLAQWVATEGAPMVGGVVLHGRGVRRVWGDDAIIIRPEADLDLVARAGSFTQVTHSGNAALVRTVLELAELRDSDHVLDLYCGIGNLSLPLARRAKAVTAVEQSRVSSEDARRNAKALGLTGLEVITAAAHQVAQRFAVDHRRFDLIVLDPPRSGAAEVLDALLALAAPRLVYVSCNPATLARDLKRLQQSYRIDIVQPVDLFPQTYHVEAVVRATHV